MNCPKCGNPINPNMKFCAKCGTPVAPAPQQPMQQRPVAPQQPAQPMQSNNAVQPQPAKKKRKKKKNLGLIITAIVLVIAVLSMGGVYLADVLLYKNEVQKEGYITDFPILKKKTQLLVIDDEEFPVDEYEIKVEEHKFGGILKSDAFGKTEEVFTNKSSNPIYDITFPHDGNYRITLTGIVASRINEAEDKTEEKAETIVIIIEVKVDNDNEKAIDKAAITSKEGDAPVELPETATKADGKNENNSDEDNASKPIEEQTPIKATFYNYDGRAVSEARFEYGANGNMTKRTTYNPDGSMDGWAEYNANGNVVKEVGCNPDGSVTFEYEYEYEYDAKGNVIRETNISADDGVVYGYEFTYEYDAKGNMVKKTGYNPNDGTSSWYEYEYDGDGNMIKETYYSSDGNVEEWFEYEYDDNGNVIKETVYNSTGDVSRSDEYEYEYDSDGNLKKMTIINPNGNIVGWIEYEYAEN